jgi:hypothetical protein
MPEDVTTDNLTPQLLLNGEGWEIAFEPYADRPAEALNLGCQLGMLRTYLTAQTIQCRQAIKALDLALEFLFPYTGFHDVSFDLFIKYTEVGLTFEEEQIVKALGVEF